MTFAEFFRVLLPSKVIWGADFDSDIHFALRRLEMRSWNHRVINGEWRHMIRKWFFELLTPKNYPWAFKTIVPCSTGRKEHTGRWNFALAPSEAKLSAITGFRHFSALDLTSEVTGWPRTLSLYINLFVSRRATHSFFPLCRGKMRNGLCRRGLTLAGTSHFASFHSTRGRGSVGTTPCRFAPDWARASGKKRAFSSLRDEANGI